MRIRLSTKAKENSLLNLSTPFKSKLQLQIAQKCRSDESRDDIVCSQYILTMLHITKKDINTMYDVSTFTAQQYYISFVALHNQSFRKHAPHARATCTRHMHAPHAVCTRHMQYARATCSMHAPHAVCTRHMHAPHAVYMHHMRMH